MSKQATVHPQANAGRQAWARRLEAAALFITLIIVAMRPMLGETYDSGLDSISRAAGVMGEPTPATTAWLDLGIWGAAIAVAMARLLEKRPWRLTGTEIGGVVLVAAAAVSTFAASNRRLALNASADWLTALVLVAVVANLCRDRMRIGLLLAVLGASGVAAVARSGMQVAIEYDDTRQLYQETRQDFWGAQGVALDDPRVELYERRLKAAEAGGFFPLSNTNAAWLSLAGFVFLGLRGLVWRKRWASTFMLVPAAIAFAALFLTGSKGAMLAAAAGIAIWLLLGRFQMVMHAKWRLTLLAAWVGLAGLISAGVTYGVASGGLPGDSLRFRWEYWQVTRNIVAQHWATGVGALNFDQAYLKLKPVEYPEEIRDPHNFILSVLAQWGVLGGVGLLLVFAGGSLVAARTWGTREPTESPPPVYDPEAKYASLQWVVAVAIGFILLRIWLLSGWLAQEMGGSFVFYDIGLYGVVWILVFAGLCWMARGGWSGDIDVCQAACLAGVLAFLLHNLIDLAMFFPGTLMPFAALTGILVADSAREPRDKAVASRPAVPLVPLVLGAAAYVGLVLVPVSRTSWLLLAARVRAQDLSEQVEFLQPAVAADPLDPTPPLELSQAYAASGEMSLALEWLKEAIQRDPRQIGLYRYRAGLLEMSFRQSGSMADLVGAIGAARQVAAMYPESPDDHLRLADMLARNAETLGEGALVEAIVHYDQALALDMLRSEAEIRRWPESHREAVEQRRAQLMDMAASQPAESAAVTQPQG